MNGKYVMETTVYDSRTGEELARDRRRFKSAGAAILEARRAVLEDCPAAGTTVWVEAGAADESAVFIGKTERACPWALRAWDDDGCELVQCHATEADARAAAEACGCEEKTVVPCGWWA